MNAIAKASAYTVPKSTAIGEKIENGSQNSQQDTAMRSTNQSQSEPIPATLVEGDTLEAECSVAAATGGTSPVPQTAETKRAKAITDYWPTHVYISENNFKYKSLSNWGLNTAVGCTHGCLFCYVPSTSVNKQAERLLKRGVDDPDEQWGEYVFVRDWNEEKFIASLRKAENTAHKDLKKDGNRAVMLCTTTDPYQVIRNADPDKQKELNDQHKYIVRRSLELIRDHSTLNVRILTRSPLAKIDFELMKSFGDRLLFGMSLPTLNENLLRIYEPSAPGPVARLKTLKAARDAGLNIYVAVAPTYPECGEADLRATLQAVKDLNPFTVFHEPINIRAENVARIQAHAETLGIKLKTEVFESTETWQDYAVQQLRMAERIALEVGLGERIHLWPDKALGSNKALKRFPEPAHKEWLSKYWTRVSEWPTGATVNHHSMEREADIATIEIAESKSIENTDPPFEAENKTIAGFTAKTPDEILEMTFDPNDSYLFDGVFSKGQVMTLLGPGGIGKSRLLLQLAAAMITGKEFLGIRLPSRKLKWLFIQNENSARRLQIDFQKLKAWIGADLWKEVSAHILIQTPEDSADIPFVLDDQKGLKLLEKHISKNHPDVIVFDPLSGFANGSLNGDSTMRKVCIAINQVARFGKPGCSVVVVHHTLTGREGARKATGWDRGSYGRGSKTLHSWTRGQINIALGSPTDPQLLVVSCGKNSNGQEFKPFGIRLNPETLIYGLEKNFNIRDWEARLNGEDERPTAASVAKIVANGPISKKDLASKIMKKFVCQKSVAYDAIRKATGESIELGEGKKFVIKADPIFENPV